MEIQTKNSIYELTVQDIFVAVNMQKLIRSIREDIDLATLYNKGSKWVYDQMVYFYDNVINEDIYKNE